MRKHGPVFLLAALVAATAACSTDPEIAKRQHLADGDGYLQEQRFQEAVISYRNALQQDEQFSEARMKLVEAYLGAGDTRSALRESIRAADMMPDNVDAQLRAGFLLLLTNQFPEARARATAVLAKQPRNPRALILLGNALAGLKDLDGAVEQVEAAIEEDSQLTLGYANLGALHAAKGDLEQAEAALKTAIEIAPRSESAHSALANFYWAAGRLADAERELKISLEIEPASPAANRAMASLYLGQNRVAESEPYLKAHAAAAKTTASQLLLADYYLATSKRPEAVGILEEVSKQENGFVPATLRLARLDFTSDRRTDAYQKLDEIIKRSPGNELALESRARFLLADRKPQDALAVATSLVEANPKSAGGQYVRGLALEATGAPDEAIAAFREVLRLAPSMIAAQTRLARLHLAAGNTKDALSLAQQVVASRPNAGGARVLYAQALLRSGDLVNAERELVALAKAAPASAEVHNSLGMLYEAKKDVRAARRSYERARELMPTSDVALAGLVSTDFAQKDAAAALARIEAQLAKSPNDPKLVMMSAMAYSAARDFPKAETAYRRLLQLDANNFTAYAGLGALYLRQNRLEEARRSYEEIARNQAKPVAAETMIGMILERQNRRDEARKHFERALEIDPRAAVAANNLAWMYANTGGNLDVALQLAQTAKAELPDNAFVTGTLGFIYYKKGLSSVAVTTLREASKQSPSNPDIHYHLGLAYLQNGNKADARSTLQQVLKMNPSPQTTDEVRRVLATIQG